MNYKYVYDTYSLETVCNALHLANLANKITSLKELMCFIGM